MKRLSIVVVLAMLAVPSVALLDAQGTGAKPKSMTMSGDVSAVGLDSVTIKIKTVETKFTVNRETSVTAKGATHKSLALKAEQKSTTLPDFVKVGDNITVTYHEMGANKIAEVIRVLTSVPVK